MPPVLYILECSLMSFQQAASNGIILMCIPLIETFHIIAMHSIAYTVHTLHSTYYYYYYYVVHTECRCYRCIFFCMNVAFCIDLMEPYQAT